MPHQVHLQAMTGAFALLLLAVTLWLAYMLAAFWQGQRQPGWPLWRLASFTCGTALLVTVLSPPAMIWGHADLHGHMAQHLALGMFAPIALMLGKPVTLLLRSVPVSVARGLASILASSPVRVLSHPFTALLLDVGTLYLLYLTPLFQLSQTNPVLHVLLHLHFVLAGYLFCWAIAGPDPAPHRAAFRTRLAALFLATAAHSILGKLMYGYGYPHDAGYALADIQAAQLMYYGGNLAEMALALLLFAGWHRREARQPVPMTA